MRNRDHHSLSGLTVRRAIVAAVLLGVMLPAMLVGAYQARLLYRQLDQSINVVMMHEASVVALGVRESLWSLDVDSARTLVEAVAEDPSVVSIEVLDTQHERFAFVEHAARRAAPGVKSKHSVEKIVSHRGEELGRVRLEVSEEPFMQQLRSQLAALGGTLLIQMIGSVLLILVVLHQRISNPLQRLAQEAGRLAHGDLNDPIEAQRQDEIGEVEMQLETTRRALKGLIASLEQKNTALEHDLLARTKAEDALRESEQKFSALFQESPIPLTLMRLADGTYLDVNRALTNELGTTAQEMIGQNDATLAFHADVGAAQEMLDLLARDGHVDDYEVRLQQRDGTVIDCQMHLRVLQMDEPCILSAIVDISALRAAQRKVEELNLSLEQRVVERTRALADANHEIETALGRLQRTHIELVQAEKLAALGSLVAGVAHELNTPIGNSLMVASTLQDIGKVFRKDMAGNLKRSALEGFVSESESAADILVRNLMVAGELIASFKQVAVDQTSSQRRRFSLREVLHEIVVMMQPTFRKTPYVIEEDIPDNIWLDSYPGPFGQIVTNLLGNTLLHAFDGRDHGLVRMTAVLDGEFVVFSCTDDGVGISPTHLNRIFDPFFTTKLGKHGTGLGLNIVHNIVTGVLGGEVNVDSEQGYGTSFTLRIPLNAPRRGHTESESVHDSEGT